MPSTSPASAPSDEISQPFRPENAADEGLVCSEVGKDTDVVAFVQNKHRERTDEVESCDEEYKDHEQEGQQFLDTQDAVEIRLLLVAVKDPVFGTEGLRDTLFEVFGVGLYAQG